MSCYGSWREACEPNCESCRKWKGWEADILRTYGWGWGVKMTTQENSDLTNSVVEKFKALMSNWNMGLKYFGYTGEPIMPDIRKWNNPNFGGLETVYMERALCSTCGWMLRDHKPNDLLKVPADHLACPDLTLPGYPLPENGAETIEQVKSRRIQELTDENRCLRTSIDEKAKKVTALEKYVDTLTREANVYHETVVTLNRKIDERHGYAQCNSVKDELKDKIENLSAELQLRKDECVRWATEVSKVKDERNEFEKEFYQWRSPWESLAHAIKSKIPFSFEGYDWVPKDTTAVPSRNERDEELISRQDKTIRKKDEEIKNYKEEVLKQSRESEGLEAEVKRLREVCCRPLPPSGTPLYLIDKELTDGLKDLLKKSKMGNLVLVPGEPRWQPIETAPKDGTYFLVSVPGATNSRIIVAHWNAGNLVAPYGAYVEDVTHWVPLPEPPK